MDFMTIATTFGLPACLCAILLWFIYKLWQSSEKREEILHAELAKSQQLLSETTIILKQLTSEVSAMRDEMSEIKERISTKEHEYDYNK